MFRKNGHLVPQIWTAIFLLLFAGEGLAESTENPTSRTILRPVNDDQTTRIEEISTIATIDVGISASQATSGELQESQSEEQDVISLSEDTNVNNGPRKEGKKKVPVTGAKKNTNTLENEGKSTEEKAYEPKNEVEIVEISATTHPAILRIIEATSTTENAEIVSEEAEKKESSPGPRGRTISLLANVNELHKPNPFGGNKSLPSGEAEKPYSHPKVQQQSTVRESTEKLAKKEKAHENTIEPESSTSFDTKPAHPKRSGNATSGFDFTSGTTSAPVSTSTLASNSVETIATIVVSKTEEQSVSKQPESMAKFSNGSTTNSVVDDVSGESPSSEVTPKSTETAGDELGSTEFEGNETSVTSFPEVAETSAAPATTSAGVEYEFVGLTESEARNVTTTMPATSGEESTSSASLDEFSTGGTSPETLATTLGYDESSSSMTSSTAETVATSEHSHTTIVGVESSAVDEEATEVPVLQTSTEDTTLTDDSMDRKSNVDPVSRSTEKPEAPTSEGVSDEPVTPFSSVTNPGVVIPAWPRVKIVIAAPINDVCSGIPLLQQKLAELLTANTEEKVVPGQIIIDQSPECHDASVLSSTSFPPTTTLLVYVVDVNGMLNSRLTEMLPKFYSSVKEYPLPVQRMDLLALPKVDSGNAIAVVAVSCLAFVCLVLLAGLLFIMRKRQTRFNYGERCRPVSLDAYSLGSVSAYNSVRRKGADRASKRSYGNPSFEDASTIPSHPLNFAGLSSFCEDYNSIAEEFTGIPQVSAKIDELPAGAEVKNRYANVIPLPETRVALQRLNNDPLSEYINASYVRGPKNAMKYYIAAQAPTESTVIDFWRMIWEQQSKVIIMLTDFVENGVEKCTEYVPPSEVSDCHRLYGDYQVTLKKRETKEKYAISSLILKNLENNTFREVWHIWYLWPTNGVPSDAAAVIAILLEARALQRGGPGSIVVHCSPGTGRTGTLIALDLGIRQYEITRTVDVPRVVYTIRRDRAGAVQTKEQYAFVYKALNLYATKLAGGALDST